MAQPGISWGGVIWRVVFAIALVLFTFNPSGHSFYHWFTAPPSGINASKAFVGIVLLIGWVFCIRTALVALGMLGLVLGAALFGTLVWLLVDSGWIDLRGTSAMTWVVLVIVGALLGLGLSWSLIRARSTGQVEVQ
jgi:sterol desaturase/sphingolipid hydroxylase (fatty acid hydroxylase superfamily)